MPEVVSLVIGLSPQEEYQHQEEQLCSQAGMRLSSSHLCGHAPAPAHLAASDCFGSNDVQAAMRLGPSARCLFPCLGNQAQICGEILGDECRQGRRVGVVGYFFQNKLKQASF